MSFHTRLTPIAKTSPGEIRVRHRIFQKERVDRYNGKRMTIVKVSIIERSFLLLLSLLTTPQLTKPCVTSYLLLGQVIQDRIPICLLVFTGSCPIVTKSQPFYSYSISILKDPVTSSGEICQLCQHYQTHTICSILCQFN